LKDVLQKIIESRSDESFQEVLQDSIKLLPNSNTPICGGSADGDPQPQGGASRDGNQRRKRARKMNRNFEDFIVELPATTSNENVKQIYFEIFDRARAEFDRRFTSNEKLIHVVDKISYADFSDYSELQYLEQYGIVIPKKEELECVKTHFVNNNLNKDNYLLTLFKLNKVNVFTESYNMFAAVATFGCSSAICESSFSTLTRILRPYRRSMTFARESNLTLLAFEKEVLNKISNDVFMRTFNDNKNRKLQLF